MGFAAECDLGQIKLAIEVKGEASHSPHPIYPPASTLTINAS